MKDRVAVLNNIV